MNLNNKISNTEDLFSKAEFQSGYEKFIKTLKETYAKNPSDDQACLYLSELNNFISKRDDQS